MTLKNLNKLIKAISKLEHEGLRGMTLEQVRLTRLIQSRACVLFNISIDEMLSKKRDRMIADARALAILITCQCLLQDVPAKYIAPAFNMSESGIIKVKNRTLDRMISDDAVFTNWKTLKQYVIYYVKRNLADRSYSC